MVFLINFKTVIDLIKSQTNSIKPKGQLRKSSEHFPSPNGASANKKTIRTRTEQSQLIIPISLILRRKIGAGNESFAAGRRHLPVSNKLAISLSGSQLDDKRLGLCSLQF